MPKIRNIVFQQSQRNPQRIVCFGGGNAAPKLLLEVLKKRKNLSITAITSMVDNGGSTGQLRRDFAVLPPGDIRRHILALSDAPLWKKELWKFRFGREVFDDGHKGHSFANVFIGGLEYILKDYKKVLKIISEFMEIKGHRALPATIDKVQLMAELENGEIVEGEDEIDVPKKHNPKLKIKRVFLRPKAKIFPETKKAIAKADLITFGPGDLYSSTIPCLLPQGMKETIKKSKAKKVLVANAMTKLGETAGFSVSDFTGEVKKYMDSPLDFVLYNTEIPDKRRIKEHKKKEPLILDLVKINEGLDKRKFIGRDLLVKSGSIVYDAKKVVKIILNLF